MSLAGSAFRYRLGQWKFPYDLNATKISLQLLYSHYFVNYTVIKKSHASTHAKFIYSKITLNFILFDEMHLLRSSQVSKGNSTLTQRKNLLVLKIKIIKRRLNILKSP